MELGNSNPCLDYLVFFIIPKEMVKNREDRLVVLNRISKSVIDKARGQHLAAELSNLLEVVNSELSAGLQKVHAYGVMTGSI